MDRRPDKSTLKGIGCPEGQLPTVVLIGQNQRPSYQIQVLTTREGLKAAWKYIDEDQGLRRVSFQEVHGPGWLKKAQDEELKLRKQGGGN